MIYIKPEIVLNQSSSIEEILAQGSQAAQQQNWLEVSDRLKLLPQSTTGSKNKLFLLNSQQWQTAFDLSLKILIQADFQHKWEITKLLPSFGSKVITPLSTLVIDETIEPEVRWFICQALGNFPEPEVILTLLKLLQQTTDSELVNVVGKTLIKFGDRAIDALVDLLSQPEHRRLAVQSLFYIHTSSTITPLLEVAQDCDRELRTIAIEALGSFHDPRIPPVLITALQDKASSVRTKAAIALGFRPDLAQELDLVVYLQPLLRDLNLEVCRQAAISLGRMRQPAATTALFEVLQADTTPISLKLDLVKALGWSEISQGVSYLQQAISEASEIVVREIITVLGRLITPELKLQSARVLIDFWQNKDRLYSSPTKQVLATALGELRVSSAQKILEQLTQDGDRKVQLYALSALKKLSSSS